MLIYCTSVSARLEYIARFISGELLEASHAATLTITTDRTRFENCLNIRINYSNEIFPGHHIRIVPHGLLEEKGIKPQQVDCIEINGSKAFFKAEGDLGFDLFAAAFYLLSRYEEYLPAPLDLYGRFDHKSSVAYREQFLDQPLVNYWINQLRKLVAAKYPEAALKNPAFVFLPTYDIDEAWAFKHKQWWRSAGAALKDLFAGRWKRFQLRRSVLNNQAPDPFEAYAWMDDLHRPYAVQPIYFFLLAAKNARYDRNNLPEEIKMQTLVKHHAQLYATGIHPSWQSGDRTALLQTEKETLEKISQVKITRSRQHFIRFLLPQTYRLLIDAGIREDYSMGYGSINGFRASVASAFYWYDLERETATNLKLYPFCFMEANAYYEQRLTPAEALEEMRHYLAVTKACGGILCTIWHNTFLGTEEKFRGWRDVYQQFFLEAVKA